MSQVTVAELVARLRAETGDFSRGMGQANREMGQFEKGASSASRAASMFGSAVESAGTAAAAAFIGAGASLAAIGTSYDTLLQKTSAAFTTILGTKKAAADMISDLTEFARSSPFPRQAFIAGAQQLTGFGIAAKNIIPIFDSVQDAVAAVGGGVEELNQFTNVFAQIKSNGRATTEELMRLGSVGVDAFSILADQSGKSVAQIRDDVTNGVLKADETIKMLTDGLTKRFDGAAANVKETWLGATDRIKGAWRDMGGALVAPFINPTGGGAAVKWANDLADVLRMLESQVVTPLGASMVSTFDHIQDVVDKWDIKAHVQQAIDVVHGMKGELTDLLPVIGLVGAAFGKNALGMIPFVGEIANAIPFFGPLTAGLIGMALSSKESRDSLMGMADTLKDGLVQMGPGLVDLIDAMSKGVASLVPVFVKLVDGPLTTLIPAMVSLVQVAADFITDITPIIQLVAGFTATVASSTPVVYGLVAAFAAWKAIKMVSWFKETTAAAAAQFNSWMNLKGAIASINPAVGAAGAEATATAGAMGGLSIATAAVGVVAALGVAHFAKLAQEKARVRAETVSLTKALKAEADASRYALGHKDNAPGKDVFGSVVTDWANANRKVNGTGIADALTLMKVNFTDLAGALRNAGSGWEDFQQHVKNVSGSGPELTHMLDGWMESLKATADPAIFTAVKKVYDQFAAGKITGDEFKQYISGIDLVKERLPGVTKALREQAAVSKELANQNLAKFYKGIIDHQKALIAVGGPLKDQWVDLWNAGENFSDTAGKISEAVKKAIDPFDALTNAQERYSNTHKSGTASLRDWMSEMDKQNTALVTWKDNLGKVALRFPDLARIMAEKGPEFAGQVAQMVNASDADLSRLQGLVDTHINASTQDLVNGISVWPIVMRATGTKTHAEATKALGQLPGSIEKLAAETGQNFGQALVAMVTNAGHIGAQAKENLVNALGIDQAKLDQILASYLPLINQLQNYFANNPVKVVFDTSYAAPGSTVSRKVPTPFANGSENHIAQIASAGSMRLWAEPETGGEAYIPLSLAKRTRSMAILANVAARFGKKLSAYAAGDTDWYDPMPDKPTKERKGKTTDNPSGIDFAGLLKLQDNTFDFGGMSYDDYLKALATRLAGEKKYSDDWVTTMNRRKQVMDDANSYLKSYYDAQNRMLEVKYSEGRVSFKTYIDDLNKQHKAAVDSTGYWGDAAAAIRQKVLAETQRHEDAMHETGAIGNAQYMTILQGRLKSLEQFSSGWMEVWRQIKQINDQAVSDAQEAFDKAKSAVSTFASDLTSEQADLQSKMSTIFDTIAGDYASVYTSAKDSFDGQSKAAADWRKSIISAAYDAANAVSAFGSDAHISGEMVGMFFDQQKQAITDFKATMQSLSTSGLDQGLLRTLAAAGPKAITFAKALQEAVGEGQTADINAAIAAIKDMAGGLGDLAGTLTGDPDSIYPTPPIPETKSFNDLLDEQTRIYRDQQAVKDAALAWGRAQATNLVTQNQEYGALATRLATVTGILGTLYGQFPDMNTKTEDLATTWGKLAKSMQDAADALAKAKSVAGSGAVTPPENLTGNGGDAFHSYYTSQPAAVQQYLWAIGHPGGEPFPGVGKAAGGPVASGMSYLVGEHGKEILTMGSGSGRITNNADAFGGGKSITVEAGAVTVDARGSNLSEAQIKAAAAEAVDELVEKLSEMLED